MQSAEQFRLLDGNGDYKDDLVQVTSCCEAWSTLALEKQTLLNETPLDAGDMDLMQYQIRELEGSMISADEFSAIEAEHRILAHGGEILEALDYSVEALQAEQSGAGPVVKARA